MKMFKNAKPVWIKGEQTVKNTNVVLEASLKSLKKANVHIATVGFYRIFVNGTFVAFGPARTARGYAREDIISIEKFDNNVGNIIRIEVAGYYCMSLSTCKQPSFVMAEIEVGGEVLAATGDNFNVYRNPQKLRKVERFSKQRHFGEVWDFRKEDKENAEYEICPQIKIIDRVAPYPIYEDSFLKVTENFGESHYDGTIDCPDNRYSGKDINERWGRYEEDEIEYKPFRYLARQVYKICGGENELPIKIKAGEYALFDLGVINCGFLIANINAAEESDVIFGMTEAPQKDTFSLGNINMQNVYECIFKNGDAEYMSFEPCTAKKIVVVVKSGEITLNSLGIKSYQSNMSKAKKIEISDPKIKGIYDAALRTFAHNVVDIYMDCPSRERAGWLCDSFFTGRAEHFFFGTAEAEAAFLENYRLFDGDELLPKGLLPMCYPSDMISENDYIPQWCMWYILEVEEYLNERNKNADKELFRKSIENILNYFEQFENSDGLLEKLPGWNFLDWNAANEWVQDVNYPTNFLYASTLKSGYKLFGNKKWLEKAEKINEKTIELSFDGTLFTDNAVRDEKGVLKNTGNATQTAQYYALYFGDFDFNSPKYEALRGYVENGFPEQVDGRKVPIFNAFIGLYVKILALLKHERWEILEKDITDFFGAMNENTGTLWETINGAGSLDHGFASFAAVAIAQALENKK